jgi:hypothetical protein
MVIINQYVGVPSLYLTYLTHQGGLFFRGKKAVDHHQAHHTRPVITNMMMEVWMQVLVGRWDGDTKVQCEHRGSLEPSWGCRVVDLPKLSTKLGV